MADRHARASRPGVEPTTRAPGADRRCPARLRLGAPDRPRRRTLREHEELPARAPHRGVGARRARRIAARNRRTRVRSGTRAMGPQPPRSREATPGRAAELAARDARRSSPLAYRARWSTERLDRAPGVTAAPRRSGGVRSKRGVQTRV